jgi:hypothetical protein
MILGGVSFTCPGPTFEAKSAGAESSILTLTASYGTGCTANGGGVAAIKMGGCAYVLHASGTVDIAGTTCGASPILVESAAPACIVEIGPQEGLKTISYTNLHAGEGSKQEVTASFNLEGIKYTAAGLGCEETGTKTDGRYSTGNTLLTAEGSGTKEMLGMSVE